MTGIPPAVELVLLALACWRLSSLFVREDGPFDILAKFRYFIGVEFDEFSRPKPRNVIAGIFSCVWCMSVWIGGVLAIFSAYSANIHTFLLVALALSSAAIVVDSLVFTK